MFVALLGPLDFIPPFKNRPGVGGFHVAKNMRMAADELGGDPGGHVVESEPPGFRGDLAVHDHLEQQIAQFLAKMRVVVLADGLDRFIGLFDHPFAERVVRLFAVPRATVGSAEPGNNGAKFVNGSGHGGRL